MTVSGPLIVGPEVLTTYLCRRERGKHHKVGEPRGRPSPIKSRKYEPKSYKLCS